MVSNRLRSKQAWIGIQAYVSKERAGDCGLLKFQIVGLYIWLLRESKCLVSGGRSNLNMNTTEKSADILY